MRQNLLRVSSNGYRKVCLSLIALFYCSAAFGQATAVSGIVTGSGNQPLVYAKCII